MRHKCAGEITSIGDSYSSPDHVNVSVAHGPRPRRKKTKAGQPAGFGDNRPTSSISLPRKHAKHYAVGDAIDVGIGPSTADPETKFRRTVRKMTRKGY